MNFIQKLIALPLFAVFAALGVEGCGGGSGGGGNVAPPPPPTYTVTVTSQGNVTTVESGATLRFFATVASSAGGQVNQAVKQWTVSAGSISPAGMFTAPTESTNTPVTVTALAAADGKTTGSMTITVTPIPPSPPTATLTASVAQVTAGQSLMLTYGCGGNVTSANESSTPAEADWSGAPPSFSGTQQVTPGIASGMVQYGFSCAGPGGTTPATPVTVTVNPVVAPPPMTINAGIETLYFDTYNDVTVFNLTVTGQQGDEVHLVQLGSDTTAGTLSQGQASSGTVQIGLSFPKTQFARSALGWYLRRPSTGALSNKDWVGFLGDGLKLAGISATDIYYQYVMTGAEAFKISTGAADFAVPNASLINAISVDKTGQMVASSTLVPGGVIWFNSSGVVNSATNGKSTRDVDVVGGSTLGCVTQPAEGNVSSFDTSQNVPTMISPNAQDLPGTEPWSDAAGTVANIPVCVLFSRNGTQTTKPTLWLYSLPDMTLLGSFIPTGVTPSGQLPGGVGGSRVALLSNGTVALLSFADRAVNFGSASLTSMTETHRLDLTKYAGSPYLLAKYESQGSFIVGFFSHVTGTTTFFSVDPNTLAVAPLVDVSQTPIETPSGFMGADAIVSADGKKLYVPGIDATTGATYPLTFTLSN